MEWKTFSFTFTRECQVETSWPAATALRWDDGRGRGFQGVMLKSWKQPTQTLWNILESYVGWPVCHFFRGEEGRKQDRQRKNRKYIKKYLIKDTEILTLDWTIGAEVKPGKQFVFV